MKIAFFNYLPLEYGGGLATYFTETATELHKRYPDLEITIVTFNERIAGMLSFFYSLYFWAQRQPTQKVISQKTLRKSLPGVVYRNVATLKELHQLLIFFLKFFYNGTGVVG